MRKTGQSGFSLYSDEPTGQNLEHYLQGSLMVRWFCHFTYWPYSDLVLTSILGEPDSHLCLAFLHVSKQLQ